MLIGAIFPLPRILDGLVYHVFPVCEKVNADALRSRDGLDLNVYFLAAPGSAATAILTHGYTGAVLQMSAYARFFYEKLGYNVLLPEARGHGNSGGPLSAWVGLTGWITCNG
jgi:alpha-beta hydrolase superfamily lysophospholipase